MMYDAQEKMDAWRWDYTHRRPHSSLGGQTSSEPSAVR
jgi:transposase InsO family protein